MSSSQYLLLFVIMIVLALVVAVVVLFSRNSHTDLYSEGLRNENDGQYNKALQNYEEALNEIRKLKLDNKFGEKITQRIKILRTTIDYEKNFHIGSPLPKRPV